MNEYKVIKKDSLAKQVSDKLENMIENGKYSVGEKIPTEPELMQMFSVSRNTVREAVQSLTWSGILEIRQGNGTYVRAANRFRANMKERYGKISLQDINEARNGLEVTITRFAALRRNKEDIKALKKAYEKRRSLQSGCRENTEADIEFHMTIARACHNVILIDLYESISDYLEEHIRDRNMDESLDFQKIELLHEQLYKAVVDGNAEIAEKCSKDILKI